ncbi:hypothetical protein V7S43_016287 [Phytophthora oleae]|uniref:GRIP domain-containing protein n=1 Tax=Phytophthora oleae TaxID=2107226 RepID=A0ABD3EWR1_9STRA
MEKDLRDAYAALKLLRADLVKTRRDKRALEASLMQFQTHGPPPSAAQTRESRETQQMQHEDANSQLWRLAALYEIRLAEMEIQLLNNNCKMTEEAPEAEDNQQEDEHESEGLEKLALLNKLHSLTATVEQQTHTMLAQQAAFALQKGELETTLEDLQHKLQTEERKVADAVMDQQAAKENYEFLETQVEILKEEKKKLEEKKEELEVKLAAHAQTSSILKQQLEEKEEERRDLEAEQAERELKHQQKREKSISDSQQENEEKEKKLRDAHEREIVELQQKCELLELELCSEKEMKRQDQDNIQARYTATLQELETSCAELKEQLAQSKAKRDAEVKENTEKLADAQEQHAAVLHDLRIELEEAQTERNDKEMRLEEALETLKDQLKDREQHTVTLRDLEDNFTSVKAQLATAEAKLTEEAEKHEELLAEASQKLQDQERDHERRVATLCKTENKLAKVQAQLADADAKRLSEVEEYEAKLEQISQRAAQHEKLSGALAMEKKVLQQEICEAQQTSKLTTEEFQTYQLMTKQKTLDHFNCLNRTRKQCENLETQLLSAEDSKETRADKTADSYTLKAFRGLADTEIAALPPSRSWKLLRSGINELEDFLPHLQALVQALSDVLALCKNHSDTLPALCERLEGKTPYDKNELPILTSALRLLRFAAMLKDRIQQEDTPVAAKSVQVLRKRVLDALAQWYECDSDDNSLSGSEMMPTPTFTITSRETALILQNWTNDRTKQVGVRRWLARMEAYPGVPPLRGASSNRVLELPPEGCTLELEDMTSEVKDAFLLLLIPILKQNRALHVRVFTRYTGDRDEEDQEKVWAMRIHVQGVVAHKSRPSSLKLSPSSHGLPSPLVPNSPASSVSSSTSSSASSRLQIIQERLQYLYNNA